MNVIILNLNTRGRLVLELPKASGLSPAHTLRVGSGQIVRVDGRRQAGWAAGSEAESGFKGLCIPVFNF